jgi:hypothetical protein
MWRFIRARCLGRPDANAERELAESNEDPTVKSTNYAINIGYLKDD